MSCCKAGIKGNDLELLDCLDLVIKNLRLFNSKSGPDTNSIIKSRFSIVKSLVSDIDKSFG